MPLYEPPSAASDISSNFAAKGDLLVGTAASTYTNLGVGVDGKVLTAASGQASGLQWADAPSPTQVSRPSGAAGDYIIREKLTADTQYRLVGELRPTTSEPELLFGPGGTTAPDVRITRDTGPVLLFDPNGTYSFAVQVRATSGYTSTLGVGLTGDTVDRIQMKGDSAASALLFSGGASFDARLGRSANAGRVIYDANGTANDTEFSLDGTSGKRVLLNMRVATEANPRLVLSGDATLVGFALGPGGASSQDLAVARTAAKTLTIDDGAAGAAVLAMVGHIDLKTESTPGNPASGYVRLYAGTDNMLHARDSTGDEGQSSASYTGVPPYVQVVNQYQASSTTCVVTMAAPTPGNTLLCFVGASARGATSITQTNVAWTRLLTNNGNSFYTEVWVGVVSASPGTTATVNYASGTTSQCAVVELPADSTPAFSTAGTPTTVTGTGATAQVPELNCSVGDWVVWLGGAAVSSSYSGANMPYLPVLPTGGALRGGILKAVGGKFSVWSVQNASGAFNELAVVLT